MSITVLPRSSRREGKHGNSNGGRGTGRKPAEGKLLRNPKTPKKVKEVAASDLCSRREAPAVAKEEQAIVAALGLQPGRLIAAAT